MTARTEQIAQPKVDNLNIPILANQNILNLQIPMHDTIPMAVVQRARNLPAKLPRLLLFQPAVADDVVEHLPAVDVLEQHVPVVIRAHDVAHAADVGVVNQRDDGRFPRRAHLLRMIGALALRLRAVLAVGAHARYDFDGDLLARLFVARELHFAHAAGADGFAEVPVAGCGVDGGAAAQVLGVGGGGCAAFGRGGGAVCAAGGGGGLVGVVARRGARVGAGLSH